MTLTDRPRVLCVDDEPNLLAGLVHTLRRRFDVTTAGTGAEAMQALAEKPPFQVIVSDLRMPAMDGIELFRRAREEAPDAVRVLLTGHATLEAAVGAVNEGHVFRFLLKPCPPEQLVGAIEEAAAQSRAASQERARLETRIEDLSDELQEAARLATAGRLASSFGHEINNMVTVLDGAMGGLQDALEGGTPISTEDLAALAHVRRHLASHGRSLMRLGKPGRTGETRADLGRCIADAVAMIRDTGPMRRAEVVLEVPPEPVFVGLGATQVEQIVLNLVKNAADAVREVRDRRHRIRIAAALDPGGATATCTVEDDGVGIPAERLPLLFEPFHTTKGPDRGTGLGLFVVRHIVEGAGGTVGAASLAGAGSTFTFTLPVATED